MKRPVMTRRRIAARAYTHGFGVAFDCLTDDGALFPRGPSDPRWQWRAEAASSARSSGVGPIWHKAYARSFMAGVRGAVRHILAGWEECRCCGAKVTKVADGKSPEAWHDELCELHWSSCPLNPENLDAPAEQPKQAVAS